MGVFTVWGDAGGPGQIAADRSSYSGKFVSGRSDRSLSLEPPAEGVPVDCDHDGNYIGELVHAELGNDDRLRCVAVVEGLDLDRADAPVFFSPLTEMVGGVNERSYVAREANLLALALTFETARLGAFPVSWLPGDVRDPLARYKWSPSSLTDPVIRRATNLERQHKAAMIHQERFVDERQLNALTMVERMQVMEDQRWEPRRPRGRIERGAPVPNSILSVR